MKRTLMVLAMLAIAANAAAFSYPIGTRGFEFDVTTTIPLAKVQESTSPGATADVVPFVAFGGGLTTYWTDKNDPDRVKIVSINFPILAVSAREGDDKKLDLTLIADVGFFDNKVRIGGGWNFGRIDADRSRAIAVFSIGTNIFE